jgi:hypothetical protein
MRAVLTKICQEGSWGCINWSRNMKQHQRYKIWVAGSILLLGFLCAAHGQIVTPLAIGNTNPVTDVVGRLMPGTWLNPYNQAVRVEVREVGIGIAPPDPVTGEGNDTANPLFLVTHMGYGVIPNDEESGIFSYTLTNRIPEGVEYYARIYDAPAPGASHYYANSVPFQEVPPEERNTTTTIEITFQQLSPWDPTLDVSDLDGDLLPAWMEDEYSTDPNLWDSDEDGYYDGFEVLHSGYLENWVYDINEIVLHTPVFTGDPPETNEYYVSWWAIPGVAYRLEYRDAMTDGLAFTNIWDITPEVTNAEISVDWVTNTGVKGFFRYLIP